MTVLEKAYALARNRRARVVFPEMDDPRVAAAVDQLTREGLVEAVPLAPVSDAHGVYGGRGGQFNPGDGGGLVTGETAGLCRLSGIGDHRRDSVWDPVSDGLTNAQ